MTFHERGSMLKELALHLRNHLDKFYPFLIRPAPRKQIAGLILKAASEIFLPMLLFEENFLMKLFALMAKVIT